MNEEGEIIVRPTLETGTPEGKEVPGFIEIPTTRGESDDISWKYHGHCEISMGILHHGEHSASWKIHIARSVLIIDVMFTVYMYAYIR